MNNSINSKIIAKNATLNMIKTIMGIICPLISFPYLSRVLGVINIGKVNYANSIVSYFLLIAGLGITNYAIREGAGARDAQDKIDSLSSEIFTINIFSMLVAYLALFCIIILPGFFSNYNKLIIIYSFEILFTTVGVDWVFSIYENYLYVTLRSIIFAILRLAAIFIFIKTSDDYIKYVILYTSIFGVQQLLNFWQARRYCRFRLIFSIKRLLPHIVPILFLFSINVATTIYVNSDTTILGYFSGDYYVGLYSMATKVYSIIKQVLAAIIIVTVPRLSYLLSNNLISDFKKISNEVMGLLLFLSIPVIIGLTCNSEGIVILLGGSEYKDSAYSLIILSFALFFTIFSSFFNMSVLLPLKKEKVILISTSISAVVNVVLNIVFIPQFNEIAAASTTLVSELLSCLISGYYAKEYIVLKKTIKIFSLSLIGTIPFVLISILSNYCIENSNIALFVSVFVSIIEYFVIELLLKNEAISALRRLIKKGE